MQAQLQYEPGSADLYVFGSPKNTEGYQFSKTFFGVIFANNPNFEESLPIKHAGYLQDAGVTARGQLEFTASRAVCRLTQVLRGRGAKRGELRGAACAGQGRASCAWGGSEFGGVNSEPPQNRPRSVILVPLEGR